MPIFKVMMTETEIKTIQAYVIAANVTTADDWASKVEDGSKVGKVISTRICDGTVERLDIVSAGAAEVSGH